MRKLVAALSTSVLLAAPPGFVVPKGTSPMEPALATALEHLRPEPLASHIAWLTDPARAGRGLGSEGLEAATRYVEAQLRSLGLAEVRRQRVPLRRIIVTHGSLRVRAGGRQCLFRHGEDFLLPEWPPGRKTFPLVAAPPSAFEQVRLRGKAVLLPCPAEPHLSELDEEGARLVLEEASDFSKARAAWKPEPFFAATAGPWEDEPPVLRLSSPAFAALKELLAGGKTATLSLTIHGKTRAAVGFNVLALRPGADPHAPALLMGAHLDHLGMRGGRLHPGADDNASGVAAVLEIARSLAAVPLRSPVRFAFWTGEEAGKFGSGHYVRHPLHPLAHLRAYLNLDMIGHAWTAEDLAKLLKETRTAPEDLGPVDLNRFAEVGHAARQPELSECLTRAALATGMTLRLDPGDGTSGGSDYRPFARAQVPWVRFFGNFFPAYHTPEDQAERLDMGQVHRMARLALAALWEMAR